MGETHRNAEWIKKHWKAPIYAFFEAEPLVTYVMDPKTGKDKKCYTFCCTNHGCTGCIRHHLDSKDKSSTSNLRKHAKQCWGEDQLKMVDDSKNIIAAHNAIGQIYQTGTITVHFERKDGSKITYSNKQHTKTEIRYDSISQIS